MQAGTGERASLVCECEALPAGGLKSRGEAGMEKEGQATDEWATWHVGPRASLASSGLEQHLGR